MKLIDVANNILLNCGERPLTTTNTTIGKMVVNAIRTALVDVANSNDWMWLKTKVIAESWNNDTATLPEYTQRLVNVTYDTTRGYPSLQYLPDSEFVKYLPSYGFTGSGTAPRYYTYTNQRTVKVLPYPNDATTRAKVWFDIIRWIPLPATDNDEFTIIPLEFLELVITKASYLFGLTRGIDGNKTAEFERQYLERLRSLRSRQMGATVVGFNIQKRGRR